MEKDELVRKTTGENRPLRTELCFFTSIVKKDRKKSGGT